MDELSLLRQEIEGIDEALAKLFQERLKVVKKIALCKKESHLAMMDKEREIQLLEKNSEFVSREFHSYYEEFFQALLHQSKKYQKRIWDESECE